MWICIFYYHAWEGYNYVDMRGYCSSLTPAPFFSIGMQAAWCETTAIGSEVSRVTMHSISRGGFKGGVAEVATPPLKHSAPPSVLANCMHEY